MAGKRSGSKRGNKSNLVSRLVGIVWFLVTAGGVTGWAVPDTPVLGPFVQRIVHSIASTHGADRPAEETADGLLSQLEVERPTAPGASSASAPGIGAGAANQGQYSDTITIASFNIQVFGESKLGKKWVVEILAEVVRQFDVVAIQELRCKDDHIIPEFVKVVNAGGRRYSYVVGPRLGRTVSKEQYVFVYDTDRIDIDTSSSGTIQDPLDKLHREPFVTRFRARTATPANAFTFWLVNSHTDPDEVPTEIDALADVFLVMQQARPDEDDVILLGDLNASDRQFGRLGQIPGITWAVHGTTTNTRKSKMYDNLLLDRNRTAEYTGRWGVYDLESAFKLTRDQALQVSDHLPVWAEFSAYEAPRGRTARR
jgi:endonuclease/exonuclease/phosphatase family metal-dependent hydrolase